MEIENLEACRGERACLSSLLLSSLSRPGFYRQSSPIAHRSAQPRPPSTRDGFQRRLSIRAAIAGETRSVLWMRTKLYQSAYSATMYSWFCSFLLKPFVSRVNRRIAETLPYRDVADHRGNPNCGCRPDPAESDPAATRGKLALDARPHHQVGTAPGASAPPRGYAGRQCSRYPTRIQPRRSRHSRDARSRSARRPG